MLFVQYFCLLVRFHPNGYLVCIAYFGIDASASMEVVMLALPILSGCCKRAGTVVVDWCYHKWISTSLALMLLLRSHGWMNECQTLKLVLVLQRWLNIFSCIFRLQRRKGAVNAWYGHVGASWGGIGVYGYFLCGIYVVSLCITRAIIVSWHFSAFYCYVHLVKKTTGNCLWFALFGMIVITHRKKYCTINERTRVRIYLLEKERVII